MTLGELWRRARAFVLRDRMRRELEEEMQLHVALRAESLAAAGMPAKEAALAAKRRFGNVRVISAR